jgi:hypothetical protein
MISDVYIYVCIALEQLSMLPSNFYMTICSSSSFIIKPEILPAHKIRGSRVCGGVLCILFFHAIPL